ncbi:hypothetical protein BGZ58_007153 [Dissophora ornata]|nr:hypothetical protein BGZ58_007153 [Dissophora ornata]
MSNLIDSFASSSHTKQGFYGKQLKVIGSSSSSPSATGAELDLTIKIHVIENTWTTCPLLPPSTILHRWKVTHIDTSNQTGIEPTHEGFGPDLAHSRDGKDVPWVQAALERTETISPVPSPTFDQRSRRPLSTYSVSSYTGQIEAQTHIAVLSNALCFVANKAGDYIVQLSVHAPFVAGTGSRGIHLSFIPKCRSNFIQFRVLPSNEVKAAVAESDLEERTETMGGHDRNGISLSDTEGFEFNVHPKVVSLDETHLNPDSDEDAQFWLEVQELLVGRDQLVGKLVASDEETTPGGVDTQDGMPVASIAETRKDIFEVAGCFPPSSSLHVSWMCRDVANFVQDVDQDMMINITGLPDQTKSSTLLQDRKRKDPEDSHALDQADQDEELEYEHLEMDDGDLIISADDILTLTVQKLGWKQPFMDFSVELPDTQHGQTDDVPLLEISGDAVQDWEAIVPEGDEPASASELESLEKDSTVDQETRPPLAYRVWFFAGTEGTTQVHVGIRVGQAVSVGYGKDIICHIPKIKVQGASMDKGRIRIHTSNDLVIQRCDTRLMEASPADDHSKLEDGVSTRHQPVLHFQYQSSDYELAVVAQRYQALARIARIERVRAEIGVSGQQQPGFARIVLSNVVLPQQDDPYLRVYQLDGAEVWNVLVDGKPCSKSIQFMDRKPSGQRTILVPIPEESSDSNNLHQVEISYGFNTLDRESEEDLGEETVISTIKLAVPGFNLPVGEYVVVANLPKLEKDMDYEEPTGDFEVMSNLGLPGQRRTITYGAYMMLGRPKLSIRTAKIAARYGNGPGVETVASEAHEQNSAELLEQISRSNLHATVVVHDPQQPPFNTGLVTSQQASQRHPQQPLEFHNPQVESTLDGEILPVLSARANAAEPGAAPGLGQTSSPQVGSPALLRSTSRMTFNSQETFSLKSMSTEHVLYLARRWWKPVMSGVAALALVFMIINVAAFQETKSTSLDLVSVPAWRRPFAAFGRLWYDSSVGNRQTVFGSGLDEVSETFDVDDMFAVTASVEPLQETPVPEPTHGLEVRGPPAASHDDPYEDSDYGKQRDARQEPARFVKLVQFVKQIVRGLKKS